MKLIKENTEWGRKVFELEDRFRKEWTVIDRERLEEHIIILDEVMEGWVIDWGVDDEKMFIEYHKVPGTPASEFAHTPQFIKKIYDFFKFTINETSPYAHYDWVLSNIMIDGDKMYMVDWDNVGLYNEEQIMTKLHSDLTSAFGDKFDPASL